MKSFQRTDRIGALVRNAMADLSHFLSERLSALRPIRFHRTEDEERERLSTENRRLSRAVVRYQLLDSAVTGAPGLLLTLALAAAPVFAMQPVDRENPRVAALAAICNPLLLPYLVVGRNEILLLVPLALFCFAVRDERWRAAAMKRRYG